MNGPKNNPLRYIESGDPMRIQLLGVILFFKIAASWADQTAKADTPAGVATARRVFNRSIDTKCSPLTMNDNADVLAVCLEGGEPKFVEILTSEGEVIRFGERFFDPARPRMNVTDLSNARDVLVDGSSSSSIHCKNAKVGCSYRISPDGTVKQFPVWGSNMSPNGRYVCGVDSEDVPHVFDLWTDKELSLPSLEGKILFYQCEAVNDDGDQVRQAYKDGEMFWAKVSTRSYERIENVTLPEDSMFRSTSYFAGLNRGGDILIQKNESERGSDRPVRDSLTLYTASSPGWEAKGVAEDAKFVRGEFLNDKRVVIGRRTRSWMTGTESAAIFVWSPRTGTKRLSEYVFVSKIHPPSIRALNNKNQILLCEESKKPECRVVSLPADL